MKKVCLILAIICVTLSTSMISCKGKETQAKLRLKVEIADANKGCPMNVPGMGVITSWDYDVDRNIVTMKYELEPLLYDGFVRMGGDYFADQFANVFSVKQFRKMAETFIDAGASMELILIRQYTGEQITGHISNDQIKEKMGHQMSKDDATRKSIKMGVDYEKSQLPMEVEVGMTLTDIIETGSSFIYCIDMDPEMYDIDFMIDNKAVIEPEMRSELMSNPTFEALINNAKSVGLNVIYRYENKSSGKSVDFYM